VLAGLLQDAGYDVSVIYLKLPSKAKIDWFKNSPTNYEMVDISGEIIGFNADVSSVTQFELDLLIAKLAEISPDLICISSKSTDSAIVLKVLPKIREKFSTPMIAGGFGPTLDPDLYADLVDYVFVGEAENAIVEIATAIENGRSLKPFRNIYYKNNGVLVKNKLRAPEIENFRFQAIPAVSYYIDHNKVYDAHELENFISAHAYSTFFGRGCISTCSYCSAGYWHKIYAREGFKIQKRRNRRVEDIIEELKEAKARNCTFVLFRDEFLCAETIKLKQFFQLYEKEICLPFWAFLVPEQILSHPEILEMAVDAGFVATEIGIQSGSDRINRNIFTRFLPNRKMLDYARLLQKYNIITKYDFIIFNPAETWEDIQATFRLIQSLPKERTYLQLARLHFFPESPIINILKNYVDLRPNFDHFYCQALLYLLSFVLPVDEFEHIIEDESLTSSWRKLKQTYKSYAAEKKIEFMVGTHDRPDSITTHRYQRILEKNNYKDVIVCSDSNYYKQMSHIFKDVKVTEIKFDNCNALEISEEKFIGKFKNNFPIFICGKNKKKMKTVIQENFPAFSGMIFV
jgi:radical SAM superfamily enzyme YgiQ (UPF0313 family)